MTPPRSRARVALLGALLATFCLGASAVADVEPAPPAVAAFPTPLAGTFARVLAALAAIAGAGAGLAWWSRRRRGAGGAGASRIQVLATRAIGPRHHVVLIEVGERRLLLGTAPESVRTLADLSELEPFSAQLARHVPEIDGAARRELLDGIGPFEGLDA